MKNSILSLSARTFASPRRWFVLALLAIGLLVVAGYASGVNDPEMIGQEFVETAAAAARNAAGECHDLNAKCLEWCFIYQGGTTQASGTFCCVENGTGDVLSCGR